MKTLKELISGLKVDPVLKKDDQIDEVYKKFHDTKWGEGFSVTDYFGNTIEIYKGSDPDYVLGAGDSINLIIKDKNKNVKFKMFDLSRIDLIKILKGDVK